MSPNKRNSRRRIIASPASDEDVDMEAGPSSQEAPDTSQADEELDADADADAEGEEEQEDVQDLDEQDELEDDDDEAEEDDDDAYGEDDEGDGAAEAYAPPTTTRSGRSTGAPPTSKPSNNPPPVSSRRQSANASKTAQHSQTSLPNVLPSSDLTTPSSSSRSSGNTSRSAQNKANASAGSGAGASGGGGGGGGLKIKLNITPGQEAANGGKGKTAGKATGGRVPPPPAPTFNPSLASEGSSGRAARVAATKGGAKVKKAARDIEMDSDRESQVDELESSDDLASRPSFGGTNHQGSRRSHLDDDLGSDEDDFDLETADGTSRAVSPSKLTARQRAKGNKDLQETLLTLPDEVSGKKLFLTEAERQERREETARKRKRQMEQKLQEEQETTINRLLRAQTGRSRNKIAKEEQTDVPEPSASLTPVGAAAAQGTAEGIAAGAEDLAANTSGTGSRKRARQQPVREGMIRWVSSIAADQGAGVSSDIPEQGKVVVRVGVPQSLVSVLNFAR